MKWDKTWINSMKWSWIKVPVKVEQINEYLLSDTLQIQKNKNWQWWNKPRSKCTQNHMYCQSVTSLEAQSLNSTKLKHLLENESPLAGFKTPGISVQNGRIVGAERFLFEFDYCATDYRDCTFCKWSTSILLEVFVTVLAQ